MSEDVLEMSSQSIILEDISECTSVMLIMPVRSTYTGGCSGFVLTTGL